ncbi:hypothetical protein PBI_MYXUS_54 [Mycobacterium phage Myxus]|uniref:Uncharacterized protein n=10 Tax=Fromanvirus TaxID=186764 RepID=A0A142K4W2_9CAUD|nr:hypothetical protein CM07_gp52 [Mycobacterium phage Alma]YP_009214720.1 hypothetical protein AVV05_gp055 [Mycobacterium phage Pioneer]YP_009301877.1 hypothetical protein BJD80_gp056 [Mycobacterium phage Catalina]YP_009636023.1 hypothetical protein FGG56_gp50 [Mycobacterium phage PackMan]AMO43922.1 hypothetical protein PBI_MYXUS_54 [Mycobacterium phage Myxus]AMS00854.1 hypothetical protein PBI_EIDSMOE_54 [Mycobacterium phage Eidsmoe]AOQ29010.1 hypothetical protein SEA_HORTUMSL17_54 [Mycobac
MRENFGNGWSDRGPRKAVKGWDASMRSCKPTIKPPKAHDEENEEAA